MNTHLKIFLASASSILAIYPSTSYAKFIPNKSSETRIRECWGQTGVQLSKAMMEYERSSNATQQK